YTQAADQARIARRQEPTTTIPPVIPPVTPSAPTPIPRPEPEQPPATVVRPATPAPQPSATPPATPSPAAIRAADEAAIRGVLNQYAEAFSSLNVEAVQRLHPSVNAEQLRRSFTSMRLQSLQILDPQITINGATATVTSRVQQISTPKVGTRQQSNLNVTFILRKTSAGWIIGERR